MSDRERGRLADLLHQQGMRLTDQRALLLDLIETQSGHLDAREIYRLARQRDPHINLSTVYRTVGLLRDLGLVDEVHLAEDHHHYEAGSHGGHQHLICLDCGQIIEFTSPLVARLVLDAARARGFEVTGVRVDLTGYCPACRARRLAQAHQGEGGSASGA